ncbi:MAG: sulfotransferase [Gammaproteobacteria bacterium]|nr:sulfotransferase [Gammaproteobacteria bacterium]
MDKIRRAASARAQGNVLETETLCKQVLESEPGNPECNYMIGTLLIEKQQYREARIHLELALRSWPAHPGILTALGNVYFLTGDWNACIACYQTLHASGNIGTFTSLNLAIALINTKDLTAASVVLERALTSYPDDSGLWNVYGDVLNRQHRDKDAEAAFQRALKLAPGNPDIRANLALLYEQSNKLEEAENLAQSGLKQHPAHASLILTAARCLRRRKHYRDALSLLNRMTKDADLRFVRAAEFERGRIYDALDDIDQAYAHFKRGNLLAYEIRPESVSGGQQYLKEVNELVGKFKQDDLLERLAVNAKDENYSGQSPVFLLGFLRSGTTLMDTILQSSPNVAVLEEEPTLDALIQYSQSLPGGYPSCLAATTNTQRAELRSLYWNTVNGIYGANPAGKLLIDKQPLNSINVPLLFTIFPNAPILFALRHPCDVILSCFMQMFGTSNAHINFTSLESAAVIYASFMQAWQHYAKTLPLHYRYLRYEDLVQDEKNTMRTILEFLGLRDNAGKLHSEVARQRGRIYTPSYHQVIQPIYRNAVNRWHRYRKYFDATLPLLRPYIDYFGYEA